MCLTIISNRIIKKAAGDGDKNSYESMVYEGYGPSGVAVIVECLTDNKNRTAGDIRHFFDKFGGNMVHQAVYLSCSLMLVLLLWRTTVLTRTR